MSVDVAVLLTCFNRRETTLRCLRQIMQQSELRNIAVQIFLVDDASSDGTAAAVAAEFPGVALLQGNGSLYWTGGMHLADTTAWNERPDFLLWLNDDVNLAPDAIRQLLDAAEATNCDSLIVGTVQDLLSGQATYGGYTRTDKHRPMAMKRAEPNGTVQPVDTMNGNVVLVPAAVRARVGPPDLAFSHNMADMDYAFRARRLGCGVHIAEDFVGTCETNTSKAQYLDPSLPLRERLRYLTSPKGLPPKEWYTFTRRHCGWRWCRYFVGPYIRATVCGIRVSRWSAP